MKSVWSNYRSPSDNRWGKSPFNSTLQWPHNSHILPLWKLRWHWKSMEKLFFQYHLSLLGCFFGIFLHYLWIHLDPTEKHCNLRSHLACDDDEQRIKTAEDRCENLRLGTATLIGLKRTWKGGCGYIYILYDLYVRSTPHPVTVTII